MMPLRKVMTGENDAMMMMVLTNDDDAEVKKLVIMMSGEDSQGMALVMSCRDKCDVGVENDDGNDDGCW